MLRTYFYTASAVTGDVDAYRLHPGPDETETPRLERTATARAGENLSAIVADPDRRRLYVADRTRPAIVTFAVDPDRGALTELAVTPTSSPVVNLCLSRDRRFMYGVSYVDGTVCAHPVDADADATVTPATAASLSLGPDAHCHDIVELPPGDAPEPTRELIVSALGHDALYRVRHDPAERGLEESPQLVRAIKNSGPRHMRLARDELYVLGERDARITAHPLTAGGAPRRWGTIPPGINLAPGIVRAPGISVPDRDPGTGLPFTWAADLALSPDGQLLFSSERSSSTVSVTSARTGELLSWTATEPQPRGIALDPSGRFLLVTGERSRTVSLYEVAEGGRALRLTLQAPARSGVLWGETATFSSRGG